jgi:hypothetical protein
MAPEQAVGQQESQLSTIYQASAEQAHLMSGGKITMQTLKDAQSKGRRVGVVMLAGSTASSLQHLQVWLAVLFAPRQYPHFACSGGSVMHCREAAYVPRGHLVPPDKQWCPPVAHAQIVHACSWLLEQGLRRAAEPALQRLHCCDCLVTLDD